MIHYKDRAYCKSDCVNRNCSRFISEFVKADASQKGLLLSVTDFSENCEEYKKPKDDKSKE